MRHRSLLKLHCRRRNTNDCLQLHYIYIYKDARQNRRCDIGQSQRPMSHLRQSRATLTRVRVARQSRATKSQVLGSVFAAVCDFFPCLFVFVCVSSILGTAERICAKFTRKTCLVLRSDEFECQGQRSRSSGTKKRRFGYREGDFGGLREVYVW